MAKPKENNSKSWSFGPLIVACFVAFVTYSSVAGPIVIGRQTPPILLFAIASLVYAIIGIEKSSSKYLIMPIVALLITLPCVGVGLLGSLFSGWQF